MMLQNEISFYNYNVVKIFIAEQYFGMVKELLELPVKQNDLVMLIGRKSVLENCKSCDNIDVTYIYENKGNNLIQMDKDPLHISADGAKIIAKYICNNYLNEKLNVIQNRKDDNGYIQKGEIIPEESRQKIFEYLKKIENKEIKAQDKTIGSIVMNCNPFTLGHQYLIEYAASKVDYLYVFVVEEDRSFFKFKDRIKLVKEGCAHLNNVFVVPSGSFVLSYDTLPVYFEKSVHQEEKVDATNDLEIFARYIAPELGITKRFAGEEPTDKITKQYNEQMYIILKEFGIEFEEIPRRCCENEVISASKVKQLLKEKNWEEIKRMVPECTYEFLSEKYI